MNRFFTTIILGFLIQFGFSQELSNKGKEFWIPYSYHVNQNNAGGPLVMTLYLTSDVKTDYKVEIFGGQVIQTDTISAGQVVTCIIPNTYLLNNEGLFQNKAIRVTSKYPIVVYSYITQSAISGATLCLPTDVLGQEYISMNYTQISNVPNSNSFFTIIATEDKTTVEITYAGQTKFKRPAGSKDTIKLNRGEIYQVLGDHNNSNYNTQQNPLYAGEDLTGSRIKSIGTCKRIAVFSGSGKIRVGDCYGNSNTSDNLYQQNYPISTWGKTFLTAPSFNRPVNYYRIIKSKSEAIVKINGVSIASSNFTNNTFYEFKSDSPAKIESTEPITVAQFFTTQGCDNNPQPFDPDMIILNPVEQNISKVTLVSSNLAALQNQQHHIHVILPNKGTGLSSFTIDGNKIPISSWITHPQDNSYSYLYLNNVSQGYHSLSSDSGFNALAYGYANAESYGYSAGSNVRDLNQFASIKNKYAVVNYPSTCRESPFNLKITLPYKPTSIAWNFFNNSDLGKNPDITYGLNGGTIAPDSITKSQLDPNKELYVYNVKNIDNSIREFKITQKGIFPVEITVNNPTQDGCNTERQIPFEIAVYDPPINTISPYSSGCLEDTVFLKSTTQTDNIPILKYLWNIDGVTIENNKKDFIANFQSEGLKKFGLSIITNIGCVSNRVDTSVMLSFKAIPKFTPAAGVCFGKPVVLQDKSTLSGKSTIEEWIWSYSDKQPPDIFQSTSKNKSPNKIFNDSLTIVRLDLTTNSGCKNFVIDSIFAKPSPVIKMFLPEVCLQDSIAPFKSLATIPGNSTLEKFEWNFGDTYTTPDKNISSGKTVIHRYTNPGKYIITHSVTSNYGCNTVKDTTFFINGSIPRAEFKVLNESGLCSNTPIVIQNTSVVDVGQIGKMEIFWNYNVALNPKPDTIDDEPIDKGFYSKKFSDFNDKANVSIPIRVIAYTGGICKNYYDDTVVLNGSPIVKMKDLESTCTQKSRKLLESAIITPVNATDGVGVYSGIGVIQEGDKYYFDPKLDSGYYTIYHKYTTEKGCFSIDSTNIRVNFTPIIDAGPDISVLDDSTKQINAKATGVEMKYKWTPSTYLSSDTILQPIVQYPITDIFYTLSVTGFGNCVETDVFKMTALNMVIPTNTFTPNGDGINDTWKIKYVEKYPDCTVELYSPQGSLLYRINNGTQKAWDGTINGKPMPAGTYYYVIYPKIRKKKITGYVTLLR